MSCHVIRDEELGVTIVCVRGGRRQRCAWCGGEASALCDALLEPLAFGRAPKTCDKPMCRDHQTSVGVNVDHCPDHAHRWAGLDPDPLIARAMDGDR